MNPALLYLGFSRSTGGFFSRALGWAIRRFTGGAVNHAFFLYWSEVAWCWMTLGANANGVTEIPLAEFVKDREIVDLWLPRQGTLRSGLQKLHDEIGIGYDFSGLIGMAGVELLRRLGVSRPANWLDDHHALFCSEYCAQVVMRSAIGSSAEGLQLQIYRMRADTIDPAALDAMIAESHAFAHYTLAEALPR
jgi:hypothetical protein